MTITTHPEQIGTPAQGCRFCYERTYGVALDCAYENMQDAGLDIGDHDTAESWARSYVVSGDVSAYYCHHHDPINA